jgi:hypothetical protein
MPYWSIYCLYCQGYISDALLECLPAGQKLHPAFPLLFHRRPGAALACPYCIGLIGFNNAGDPEAPGWPVFRYSRAELEAKKQADGERPETSLTDWALAYRFTDLPTINPWRRTPMRSKHPPMKLSREEDIFLRHCMYDETHFREGPGPAKRLQLAHRLTPADLATVIAAAIPSTADQETAGIGPPPPEAPTWPWPGESFTTRLAEARALIASRGTPERVR